MKKLLALMLAAALALSLVSCGGGNDTPNNGGNTTPEEPKDTLLKVGDTAQGQMFDVTVKSVEYIDSIPNGFLLDMWSPAVKQTYQDVTAEEGFTIVKITYSFTYNGKDTGEFYFGLTLDYDDGYTFNGLGEHALPAVTTGQKVGFEEKYVTGEKTHFSVSDPLTYKGDEGVKYIIVNDEVISNTDKPFVLKIDVPTSMWDWEADEWGGYTLEEQSEAEIFVFDLR